VRGDPRAVARYPVDRGVLHGKEDGPDPLLRQALQLAEQALAEGLRVARGHGSEKPPPRVARPEAGREDRFSHHLDDEPRPAERPDRAQALSPEAVGDDRMTADGGAGHHGSMIANERSVPKQTPGARAMTVSVGPGSLG